MSRGAKPVQFKSAKVAPTPAPRPSRTSCPPAPSASAQESPPSGIIEDDVNIKERAGLFRSMTESSIPTSNATQKAAAEKASHNSKIKDMAALFEQRS